MNRKKMLALSAGALAAGGAFLLFPFRGLRLLLNLNDRQIFDAGKRDQYAPGRVDARWKNTHGIWIVRTLEGLYALSVKTPCGRVTEWHEKDQCFRAGISGQAYYKSGIPFGKSRIRPLERTGVALSKEGHVWVDTARRFRQDKDQWNDPRSFIKMEPL